MYTGSRSPAWHRDVIWCAGLVLVIATAVGTAAFAWSRLAEENPSRPILRQVLRATLLPGGDESAQTLDVRRQTVFTPGEPFAALPGSGVAIDPTELDSFTARAALDRIAGVWSERLFRDGAEALRESIDGEVLAEQMQEATDGPVPRLIEAELFEEMLGAGLDDGSRLADWPLQVQRDPDEPVQPVVGMFVYVDAADLRGLTDRQVGELVLSRLAEMVVESGADEARAAITNVNLSARFEQAISQARTAIHELFATLLMGRRAELATRLDEARSLLAGEEDAPTGLELVIPADERADLSEQEVNERVLDALAERAWQDGPEALPPLLEGDPRGDRLAPASDVIGAFSRSARDTARRVAWIAGAVAAVAFVLMAVLSNGVGRLSRPGAALLIGAAPGALLAWWLRVRLPDDAVPALPVGARAEGVFGELAGLVRYLVASVPSEAVDMVLRVHAIVAGVGLGLVLTALILLVIGAIRPRRRSYL